MAGDKETAGVLLRRLAALKGIELEYHDIWGRVHVASDETLSLLLKAQGIAVGSPEDLVREIEGEEQREWRTLTRSVWVEKESRLPEEMVFQIPVPPDSPDEPQPPSLQVQLAIEEEGGYQRVRVFTPEETRPGESRLFDRDRFRRFGIPFPAGLPLGTHRARLTVSCSETVHEQDIALIICPKKAYKPPALRSGGKRAGLVVSLAGLRSRNNWGIGDLGDLQRLVRWAARMLKVDVIGLLPLHALSNREPYNISPYYPSSRLYRNFIFLDVESVADVAASAEIRGWIDRAEFRAAIEAQRRSPWVEYQTVAGLKLQALEKAFQRFLADHWNPGAPESDRLRSFRAYLRREGEFLARYALYCALEEHFRRQPPLPPTWRHWPEPYRDPESPEVREFEKAYPDRILFYQYLQWQLEEQLQAVQQTALDSGAAIGLYFDLALGIDPCGADAWGYGDFFVSGMRAGAPPDDFSPTGQDWGFKPPNRERHRSDGYRVLKQEIRKNCFAGGALRIDHVMRFCRLFWIPKGKKAAEGAYVQDDFQDLVNVLSLESVRNQTLIVGEDLGTVPDEVRELLGEHRIYSYRLFYFEKDREGNFKNPGDYPKKALASISTHDLPTLAGFWAMKDIEVRQELGLFPGEEEVRRARMDRIRDKRRILDVLFQNGFIDLEAHRRLQAQQEPEVTPELHRAVIGFLVSTPSKLVVLNQEDLFLEPDQQNLPGTTDQYPNWKRKMGFSLEELEENPEARELAGRYREWIEKSGRGI